MKNYTVDRLKIKTGRATEVRFRLGATSVLTLSAC
jgi:hypothetical protein